MDKISVVIITFNEEQNILSCIHSAKDIADEIVVVDSGSADKTVQICEQQGCRVFFREFDFYAMQKQHAVNLAKNDWVFSLDADEMISGELASEISILLQQGKLSGTDGQPVKFGYMVPRSLVYLGHRMKSVADKPLRLFDRRKGSFAMVPVHEYVVVEGLVGKLKGNILHHSYRDLTHHVQKINTYTTAAAEGYIKKNKSFSKLFVLVKFPVNFFVHYVIRGGFLDGYAGFMWAFMAGFYTSLKIAKTIEKSHT